MKIYKNDDYVDNKDWFNADKFLFKSSPLLRFKENIINDYNYSYWLCDDFDIYYINEDGKNEPYLVYSPFNEKFVINIVRIRDKKLFKELKGHAQYVSLVKYSYNNVENKNYLVSSDWNFIVILWDLDRYEMKFTIDPKYTSYIYSITINFSLNYIITSTVGNKQQQDYIKIYSLKDGSYVQSLDNTDTIDIFYLINWEKEKNNKQEIYLVVCCYEKISIFNLFNYQLYGELNTPFQQSCGDYYFCGFISNDNKYLYTSSNEGYINIWDLYQKVLVHSIKLKNSNLYKIIPWSIYVHYIIDNDDSILYKESDNYILVSDKHNNGIYLIKIIFREEAEYNDSNNEIKIISDEIFYKSEILNFISTKSKEPLKNLKKLNHTFYGDSLLISYQNSLIDLFVNESSTLFIDIFDS